MTLKEIQKKYGTKQKCIDYLIKLRWGKTVKCTYCGSENNSPIKTEYGRFHCNDCQCSFSVTVDTIFEDSRLPLTDWFLIIGLMLNAKTGISAKEIQRNLGVTYKTAWYIAMRVRCGMIDHCNVELENIVEMDEAYLGGKPRRRNLNPNEPNLANVTVKRGRGTQKTPVVGIVERKGSIVLKVIDKLTTRNLLSMLKENVNIDNSIVVTDEFRSYNGFDDIVQHYTIHHNKKEYVRGIMHTNTIEGFWSILKNSIKGNYIAISKKYLPFYLIQSQYNFNHRNFAGNLFEKYLKQALMQDKSDYMINYKPIKPTKELAYKKCKK